MNRSDTSADRADAPRFRLLSDAELALLPEPAWIVPGILPAGGQVAIIGAPGVGKTTLAVDLCLRVATGLPCYGRSSQQGHVVFIAAEGVSGLKLRVDAWKSVHGFTAVDTIHYLTEPVQLLRQDDVTALISAIEARGVRPALVVFDTLARCFEGGDENSAEAMGRVVGAAGRINQHFGATTLFNHHPRKNDGRERGSSALRGALDAMIAISEHGELLSVTCEKMKDAAPFGELRFRRISAAGSCVLQLASDAASDPPAEEDHPRNRLLLELLANGPLTGSAWLRVSELPETSFRRHRDELREDGRVRRSPDGRFHLAGVFQPTGDAATAKPQVVAVVAEDLDAVDDE